MSILNGLLVSPWIPFSLLRVSLVEHVQQLHVTVMLYEIAGFKAGRCDMLGLSL